MTNTEDRHNGYTNRETWALALHVNNDEELYDRTREMVLEALAAPSVRHDDPDDVKDYVVGSYVVDSWYEHFLETQQHDGRARMVLNEVGSWWRVNREELGAVVRESFSL